MTARRGRRIRDRLLGLVLRLLAALPLRANHALGGALGWIAWVLPTRMARVARINLELCFPEQTPAWRRRVGRRSMMEMGKALTEAPWLWRAGPERLRALSPFKTECDLSAARPPGQALFLVAPHLGSWEFAGLHAASYGPMTSLYSPLRQPEIDRWIREARASTGARLAPATREGLRQLQAARDRGEMIGLLPDQSPRRATGVFAPFFGCPALTMTLLPRLLRGRSDRVVFAFAERLPRGSGYRYREIEAGPEVADPDPERAAAAINRLVEALVRQRPEQYNWAYKRFSPAPEGQPDPYHR
ncbi:lysophospholipid acyltransferase family protein [Thioalkalivibrio paradoxus]|uniref:lysophospholipid acyltransferase family protein n=1 Tax=Thioalkalivibrio paradoxus TaxID=108010 RepID=UPI00022C1545|nr:lysophospholipid acyltransferase family protein [Thioalkalivibrio paradoxus]